MTHTLLLEIGLEEMPARFIPQSEKQLGEKVKGFLKDKRLTFGEIKTFSTPRRLAVQVFNLAEKQEDISDHVRGPSKKIAQDEEGNWTKAAEGFTRGQGKTVDDIVFESEGDEEYAYIDTFQEGKKANEVLRDLDQVILGMNFPINMKWGNYDLEYIRPIHWIVSLLDNEIIPLEILDVNSGRITRGHRFLGGEIQLEKPEDYDEALWNESVIANRDKRRTIIKDQLLDLEEKHQFTIDKDEELLDEVTDLVELPTALVGEYDEEFLELPEEVLIVAMKDHQRYFGIYDENEKLLNYFITIKNGNDENVDLVRQGNERVLRARLDDAVFFYEEDQKRSIKDFNERLERVAFYDEIGTMEDKVNRLQTIVKVLGEELNFSDEQIETAGRAAEISKFDQETMMVNEFTELQGVIGEIYANKFEEDQEAAQAVREQYLPRTSEGVLPESDIGAALSIADKIDNILMFFAGDVIPSGSNDPHGLRRQAYAILRITEEKDWSFNTKEILKNINDTIDYPNKKIEDSAQKRLKDVFHFMKSRVRQLLEYRGFEHDVIEAVLNSNQENFVRLIKNAEILAERHSDASFKEVIESFTRVLNMRNNAQKEIGDNLEVDSKVLESDSEKILFDHVKTFENEADEIQDSNIYYERLEAFMPLIQDFYENTMVMAEDPALRQNRLAIILRLSDLIRNFAAVNHLVIK